jgi:hypothetical protein
MDSHKGLEEALDGLYKDIGVQSYVDFLAMVKTAVEALLDSGGREGRAVDKEHYLFGPILQRSSLAKLVMFMLGFEDIPETDKCMIMLDFDSHVGVMRSFRDFADKQLSSGRVGHYQARVLNTSTSLMADDPYLVAIHLGYFFFLRFLLFSLHTDLDVLRNSGVGEQVKVAADAVEVAAKKLNIMQLGGTSYSNWQQCKELVFAFISEDERTDGDDLVVAQKMSISQKMNEAANLIANELRHNYTEEFVDLFLFMHLTKQLYSQTNVGEMLFHNDLGQYLRVSCGLRMNYFSENFAESVEMVRHHCTEAMDHALEASVVARLHNKVGWQVHCLLEQLKPQQRREPRVQIGTSRATGSIDEVLMERYGIRLPTLEQVATMNPNEFMARLPTPEQLKTMTPDENEAFQSRLFELREGLVNSLPHSMTRSRQVEISNPELLPGQEVEATSRHLVDLLSSTSSATTDNETEKQDKAEKENKDWDDEEYHPSKTDKDHVPTFRTGKETESVRSMRGGDTVGKSKPTPTDHDEGFQIGKDIEELLLAVNGPMQDQSTVLSTVIDKLHQKSLEMKKLASDVRDLQKPLDEAGQLHAVVSALKPVWEKKKQQLAVTEAEIQVLESVRQQLQHKYFRDFDNEITQTVLCHILKSFSGQGCHLGCLLISVLGCGHSAFSDVEVNQLCSHFNVDKTSSDLISDLMAVLRQRTSDLN